MYAAAYFESELAGDVSDGACTFDGASRAVEGRDEPIAGGVDLRASKARQLSTHGLVVTVQHVAPPMIAEVDRPHSRGHDVGDEDRRQDSVRGRCSEHARHELFDLVEHDPRRVGRPPVVVRAGNLDPTRPSYVVRDVATYLARSDGVVSQMDDQGRHLNRWQHGAYVTFDGDAEQRPRG